MSRPGLQVLADLQPDEQIDLERLLEAAIDEVTQRLAADRGTLYLIDRAQSELVSRVAHLPELAEIRLRLGEGVAGWVARSGETVNVPRGTNDPRFTRRIDDATGYRTDSMLVVPVRDEQETVIGVLQVLNKSASSSAPGATPGFDDEDERLLRALADDVAALLTATSLRSQLSPEGEARLPLAFRFNHIVGQSPPMREVFDRTARAARTDATVLVRGESGSGKEVITRAVHVNSPRRDKPFVKVDCAALPEGLIENELFGHERGSFTGADRQREGKVAAAHGGTLFLDEVGEIPLPVQGKLLRLLQEKTYLRVGGTEPVKVDVRFVCATHRDLEAEVAAGRFRQDLYYRLRVVQIDVPPLRDRGAADLDRLIDHFLFEYRRRHKRPDLRLSRAARSRLHAHDWPGNVRELEHCLESVVVLSAKEIVEPDQLPIGPSSGRPRRADATEQEDGLFTTDLRPLKEVELDYIRHVLALNDGNRSAAARALGIGRNTLLRKLRSAGE